MVEGPVSVGPLKATIVVRRPGSFLLDISLTVAPATTVALLGPNGAGKSTVVAAVAGLIPIDEGTIELGGEVLDDPRRDLFVPADRRRVGVVFQDYLLFPHLTAIENIAFGLRSQGVGRSAAFATAGEWVERLGLGGLELSRPGELSGGQAQRVALGRALITEPVMLALDEPLAALDVTTRAEMRHALADHLAAFAGPRLLITHDPTEAFLLADEVHVIEDGVITQAGRADDIRLRPRTRYAADLAGANLLAGVASDGVVKVDTHPIHIADHDLSGPVLLTVLPKAISVHRRRPEGSPRNSWETTVERLEPLGDRVRLRTGRPLALTVEVTREGSNAIDLRVGSEVWVALKATEIGVEPDGG